MKTIIIVLAALLVFALTSPVYCEKLSVRSVQENPKEAILVDEDTGTERIVREGDRIGTSFIKEIHRSHVVIVTPVDDYEADATIIYVRQEPASAENP